MSRYRKIDMRMHGDAKYRRLSPCPPCGQALWWHLLAGRQTGIIPGVCVIGEAAFAEQLGWPLKGFREAFREVSREGMVKADWDAHLVWIPNAVKYNEPANPNVVKSWGSAWDEVPECQLKVDIYEHLKAFMESFTKGFREAFYQAFREPLRKAFGKPLPNQDQEQEQEQKQEHDSSSAATAAVGEGSTTGETIVPVKPKKARPRDELFDAIAEVTGSDPMTAGSHIGKIKSELKEADPPYTAADVHEFARRFWEFCPYAAKDGRERPTLGEIPKNIGQLRAKPAPKQTPPGTANGTAYKTRAEVQNEYMKRVAADVFLPGDPQ